MMTKAIIRSCDLKVNDFLLRRFSSNMHLKTLGSLSNAVIGALESNSLRPSQIGTGLAESNSLLPKHAIKQTDRTLSNDNIHVGYCQYELAKFLIAKRKKIIVAMDWTVFAKDGQLTITIRLITKHGRATPLLWKSVYASGLKGKKVGHVFFLARKVA